MPNSRCTINIHTGRKLSGKSREQILEAVAQIYEDRFEIDAVQQNFVVIRVTFRTEAAAVDALKEKGIRLFGIWCRIDGGPPVTIIHLFDFPHEEDDEVVAELFGTYGLVRGVRRQRYTSRPDIFTGTRLIDVVMERAPPRMVSINGFICRTWYRGQPVICNLCGIEGHKSATCPNKNKCRRCGEEGHMARSCTNAWGTVPPRRFPISADPDGGALGSTSDAVVTGQDVGSMDAAPALAPPPDSNVVENQDSVPDCVLLDVVDPASAESPPSVAASAVASESCLSDGGPSQDIEEFSSSSSSEPPSISDFSEESQSILRDVEFAVPVPGRVAPRVDSSVAGRSADASPGEGAEAMDSSVSLKRKGVPADASVAERPSRSRSCEPHRKVKPQASPSPSSRGGGVHRGLPVVSPSRPSRVSF